MWKIRLIIALPNIVFIGILFAVAITTPNYLMCFNDKCGYA